MARGTEALIRVNRWTVHRRVWIFEHSLLLLLTDLAGESVFQTKLHRWDTVNCSQPGGGWHHLGIDMNLKQATMLKPG